jgi:hypothetical protein
LYWCLSSTIPNSDSNSVSTTSASFWWLSLLPSESSDRFTLICTSFAFITVLCSPLRGLGHLFDTFHTLCNYLCTVLVCFRFIVGESTPFSFIGSFTLSSSQIRSGKDPPCNHFLIQLGDQKKKKNLSYDFRLWHSFEFVQNDDSIEINKDLYLCVSGFK